MEKEEAHKSHNSHKRDCIEVRARARTPFSPSFLRSALPLLFQRPWSGGGGGCWVGGFCMKTRRLEHKGGDKPTTHPMTTDAVVLTTISISSCAVGRAGAGPGAGSRGAGGDRQRSKRRAEKNRTHKREEGLPRGPPR